MRNWSSKAALALVAIAGVVLSVASPSSGDSRYDGGWMTPDVVRQAVAIPSTDGETLSGWLYLPKHHHSGRKLAGIVTANSLGGIKEINLPQYATRFAAAGYATLVFDYRYWGQSTGTPRFHIAPMEFRADISAAVTYLAQRREVDADRIAGWGISMGGLMMLFQATWEPRFKAIAVVSTDMSELTGQPPLTPQVARARYDELLTASRAERAGRRSAGITTMQAYCAVPQPGCALPVKEAYDFYEHARVTFAPNWENKLTSTSMANLTAADATFAIHLAKAATLIIHPDQDVVAVENVLFAYKRAPKPKRMVVPAGLHTSTYVGGDNLEMAANESVAWFQRHV